MKKVVLCAVCVFFLAAGAAHADFSLSLGGTYSSIYSIVNGKATTEGGGSIDTSSLNGTVLDYVYCVGLFVNVNVPATYNGTTVNTAGLIYGDSTYSQAHAGQIAWLLANYGTGGQGAKAQAVQAAIWNVLYGSDVYRLDVNNAYNLSNGVTSWYNTMLAKLGSNTGNVADFYWMTPTDGNGTHQGLVAPVPVPPSMLLLAPALLGLVGMRKRLN